MSMIAFSSVISYAQTKENKPSQRIQQEKAAGAIFEKTNLFSTDNKQKSSVQVPIQLKDYTLFDMHKKKLSSFRSKAPNTINLEIPSQKSSMELELVKVDVTTDDFKVVEMPSGKVISPDQNVIHYRGVVKGKSKSIAAVTFFDNNISGLISIEGEEGNIVIGQLENSNRHIVYRDEDISHLNEVSCKLKGGEDFEGYTKEQVHNVIKSKSSTQKCPRIFFDVDNDIVSDKGGSQGASNFIQSVFNQVALLYANEGITIKLSGMHVWTGNKPFYNTLGSYGYYRNRNGFKGDLGHFVTYNFSGGVAWVRALCGSNKYGVSGIKRNYSTVPTYSWTVGVIAHELGHNFGSHHTHDCVWNGNNTAIDGCSSTKGGCYNPGMPSGGGTIMSYCHLTNVGINFYKGFGEQPRNVMKNYINFSYCVSSCSGGDNCTTGDRVSVTFENKSDCTLKYIEGSYSYTLDSGKSVNMNTDIGTNWVLKDPSDKVIDSFKVVCEKKNYTTSVSCNGGCVKEDKISVTFVNNSNCVLEYDENGWKVLISSGKSMVINTYVGRKWNLKDPSNNTIDSFTTDCDKQTYTTTASCSVGGNPCKGVSEWTSSVTYYTGNRVIYYGRLFEMTNNGWLHIEDCEVSKDPCDGVSEWSSGVYYNTGNKVTYYGKLFEMTSYRQWKYLEDCGTSTSTGLPPLSAKDAFNNIDIVSIVPYPNPVKDILHLDIYNLKDQTSKLSLKNVRGRSLKIIELNMPMNEKVLQTIDMSDLSSGMYFVQVTGSKKTVSKKIFKQ